MPGRFGGRSLGPVVCTLKCSAGDAMASSTATEAIAERPGRASTRSSTNDHTRDSVRVLRRRTKGIRMRPLSTCRPSSASMAGRAVSEPSIATATTMIVPTANDAELLSPVRNCPAMATMTVRPEMRIARPEVAEAISTADVSSRPARRSSRSRLR